MNSTPCGSLPALQGVSISGKPVGGGATEIMWEIISKAAQF
jgi:hypothetical protein